jgi:hypothetical protein
MKTINCLVVLIFLFAISLRSKNIEEDPDFFTKRWLPEAINWETHGKTVLVIAPKSEVIANHWIRDNQFQLKEGESYKICDKDRAYTLRVTLLSIDSEILLVREETIYKNLPFGFGTRSKFRDFTTVKRTDMEWLFEVPWFVETKNRTRSIIRRR